MLTAKPEKQNKKNPSNGDQHDWKMYTAAVSLLDQALNPVHVQSTAKDIFSDKEQKKKKKKAKRIQIKVTCYSFFYH